jgi:hypothetical protein
MRKQTFEDMSTVNIYLVNQYGGWGVQLFDYESVFGVNDTGAGFAIQPWVMSLSEGKFSWNLIE